MWKEICWQGLTWCAVVSLACCSGCDSGGTKPSSTTTGSGGAAAGGSASSPTPDAPGGSQAPAPGGWGTLVGRFVYDGPVPSAEALSITRDEEFCGQHNLVDESLLVGADGGVANVVVYVRTKDVAIHPDLEAAAPDKVTFDNKNCRFEPHVLPVWLGKQTLLIKNSDPVGHNTNVSPLGDVGANPLVPAGGEFEYTFGRQQNIPVPVSCNIHPWMTGHILPRENPYVAVSAPDGTFKLENLPSGELEFLAWQEKVGYLKYGDWTNGRFTANIEADGTTDLGEIKLTPALLGN